MAAGFGTRLKPLTLAVPKPMVYVANRPIMQHNIELLMKYGINDACANIHYFPEQIENYFCDGSDFGLNLTYSYEEKLMGTAGGVARMAEVLGGINDTFVVLSSDALTDINLDRLLAFHRSRKSLATIALYPVLDTSQFGVVILDDEDKVTAFQEKPLPGKALSNLANSGVYVFEPEILDMIPKGKFFDFGKQLFPKLVKKSHRMYGYQMDEYWSDVGSIEQYMVANADVLNGRVNVSCPRKKSAGDVWEGKNARIGKNVKFVGPVMLGDGVEVGDDVYIAGPTLIGDKTVIGPSAKIHRSVIWTDTVIGARVSVDTSIIGSWVNVGDSAVIRRDSVLSNRCRVLSGQNIPAGSRIDPGRHLKS